jgi:hypothetical protein
MDLLFKRYASPYSFIQGMIDTGRFEEFVTNFVLTLNKEKSDKTEWEFFLHKVFDKSYNEWQEEVRTINKNQQISTVDVETIIKHTNDIINQFNSQNEGVKTE